MTTYKDLKTLKYEARIFSKAYEFSLDQSREIIARDYGYSSWEELKKRHFDTYKLRGLIDYLKPGDFSLIASRPAVGKSALAQNIALQIAKKENNVFYFDIEGSASDLTKRFLGIENDDHKESVLNLINMKIYIDDNRKITLEEILRRLETLKREHTLKEGDVVVIDYIQLMIQDRKIKSYLFEKILKELKKFTAKNKLIVLITSQLENTSSYLHHFGQKLRHLKEPLTEETHYLFNKIFFLLRDQKEMKVRVKKPEEFSFTLEFDPVSLRVK